MQLAEYSELDGTELSHLIRTRVISADEAQAAALAAIELVNPELNAVVGEPLPKREGPPMQGPFAGVPFALKDLVCHLAGVPQESGSELSRGFVPATDTDLARRWKAAGLQILARTTTPEFGLSLSTESRLSGATRNPWDLARSPGGSSGGSAALVAAGALPWAHGNDAAGSIRIPASLCGLVGLKPSRGRVPVGPNSDDPVFGVSVEFALTRTVRDAKQLYDVVSGCEPGDRVAFAKEPVDLPTGGRQRRLRIAVATRSPFGGNVDHAYIRAVHETATVFEALGHEVVEDDFAFDTDAFVEMFVTFWGITIAEAVGALGAGRQAGDVAALLQHQTAKFADRGRALAWQEVSRARATQNAMTRAASSHFAQYDLQLTPSVAELAWPIGRLNSDDSAVEPEEWIRDCLSLAPFTALHNVTGQPAISMPAGMSLGLPVGVQLAAAQGQEGLLLDVAATLEEARPWRDRRPIHHVRTLA